MEKELFENRKCEMLSGLTNVWSRIYYEENGKPCGIPSELADVVIRIFDFCGGMNIDLEKIILEKMAYNETRPYKHNRLN